MIPRSLSVLLLALAIAGCASDPATTETEPGDVAEGAPNYVPMEQLFDANDLNAHYAEVERIRGDNLLMKGKLVEAESAYVTALQRVPNHENSLVGMAALYMKRGQVERSRETLLRLMAVHPRSYLGWHQLAHLRITVDHDLAGALQAVERMVEIRPDAQTLHYKRVLERDLAAERARARGQP